MPVVRPHGTSVRERVAAIEKKEQLVIGKPTENTVIRAKYEPDVRGVNRFRHFHTPISLNDVGHNNSAKETIHLPSLVNPAQHIALESSDVENGMEKAGRKKKKIVLLPQLKNTQVRQHKKKEEKLTSSEKSNNSSKNVTELDNSLKIGRSGVRLSDALSFRNDSFAGKRTFASLGQRQNGVIINRPVNSSLEVALPPRSKSAQEIENLVDKTFKPTILPAISSSSISQNSKDTATQTSKKHISTASVEFLNCVRSTQTDSIPIVINSRRKSDIPPSLQDIEEREALLEVIEDALGETFDRYSRVRTNQIIANSARKQAQIWRDVKDFLGGQLFPTAIQLANKSSSRSKTAAEIVASIKMYP